MPFCPVDVRVEAAASGLRTVRKLLGAPKQLLVLTTRSLCRRLAAFLADLQADGHAVKLFAEVSPNPSVDDLAALLAELSAFEPTAILAIGGGSAMDLGKGVSALLHLPQRPTTAQAVRDAVQSKAYAQPHAFVPLYCMPTTSGTGSEVTHWAAIWDAANRRKLSVDCAGCYPKAAVLIPEWTASMPAALTLSTGLDALSHAMEAFWAVSRNPLSQELALASVAKTREFLPQALADLENTELRQELCLSSLLAGLAFAQTRTTACHSISYPLTMLFGVPHGFAASVTLSSVMRRNAKVVPEISRLEALFDEDEGFDAWLSQVTEGVQELCLSAFGVQESNLADIAAAAFTAGRMNNNPIVFSQAEVLDILRECL